jgi:S-adenosylmethionine:tRNA ribosyltransferase-isomerase
MSEAERAWSTADFEFDLPPEQIAQAPSERRDCSRLLVVDRGSGTLRHRVFSDLAELVRPGDALVINETRVFPARLRGRRAGGGEAEILLLHPAAEGAGLWLALVRPGAKLRAGRTVVVSDRLAVEIVDQRATGERVVRLVTDLPQDEALRRFGEVPLPPYVRRGATEEDRERYQTVYARERGSVAAPTAGLHFTPELLDRIGERGVELIRLVLHVGPGTFRPVDVEDPASHPMHSEWYRVDAAAAEAINRVRRAGGAVWAVGTTTVRTLETVADAEGLVHPGEGWTDIFIRPPYRFRAVDRLVTNFHLPRSTLLMLVSAFGGYELMMRAYREAVTEGYRFYSYGDAMAIL